MRFIVLTSLLVFFALPSLANAAPGFGKWRFGMTQDQVKKVKGCKSYRPVRVTGGLECDGYAFAGNRIKVSFVFGPSGLRKIQLWLYAGKEVKEASDRLHALVRHLRRKYGPIECRDLPSLDKVSKRALPKALMNLQTKAAPTAKLQLKPKKNPKGFFTFSSLIYNQRHGFFLFMYAQPPR